MSIIELVKDYITKAVTSVQGMKVLLMDKETTGIVSTVYPQSSFLKQEVFLFENLSKESREPLMHLKAVVIVRPTQENIIALQRELQSPKYQEYHLFFTNVVNNISLEDLARADAVGENVKSVQEYYMDYYAVNHDLFNLDLPPLLMANQSMEIQRSASSLNALLLALKKKPIIRYYAGSERCRAVAHSIAGEGSTPGGVLCLLDRTGDPQTPLLTQWCYQSMVHELLGLCHGRTGDLVLSPDTDEFYATNMFLDFGDLGVAVKALLDSYQSQLKDKQNIQSIEDIKHFLDSYPQLSKVKNTISTHVTIMEKLSKIVQQRDLMTLGELEQQMVCHGTESEARKNVLEQIRRPEIELQDKLRLSCIYGIRFGDSKLSEIVTALTLAGLSTSDIALLRLVVAYGKPREGINLYGDQSLLSKFSNSVKRGLTGVANVFTEHRPYLEQQLMDLAQGKLKENIYPAIGGPATAKATDIIVFIMGGVTYEEAALVAEINEKSKGSSSTFPKGFHVLLGGDQIINSKMFLESIRASQEY